jgi:haloalkane dehalogenase
VELLRTPDERFASLPGYAFAPHYLDVDGVRIHYVDEGDSAGPPIFLLHGEPSWSYLY